MSNITDRVAFIQGLAEGMKLSEDTNEGKLLRKMLEVLGDMASELKELRDSHEELSEYVESIDDDLADLEENVFGDEDECSCCPHGEDEDEDEDDDEDENETVDYTCPHCGHEMTFEMRNFDFDEDYLCPECNKPLFPDTEDEDK